MRTFSTAVVLATLITFGACAPAAPPPVDTSADEAAMQAATKTWGEAFNAGEVDRIVALYAEDAVVMPPNAPAVSGSAAIREFMAAFVAEAKAGGLMMGLGETGGGVSGDLGWHSGTYAVTNAAGVAVETGKWVETWRRAGGEWRMIRDIWNTDAAPTPPAAPAK